MRIRNYKLCDILYNWYEINRLDNNIFDVTFIYFHPKKDDLKNFYLICG